MATGVYIDHQNGFILDATKRVGKFIGYFDTNGLVSGVVSDNKIVGKKVFHVAIYYSNNPAPVGTYGVPILVDNVAGSISWDFKHGLINNSAPPDQNQRFYRIYYGVM